MVALVLFYWMTFSVQAVRAVSPSALMLGLATITVTTLKMLVCNASVVRATYANKGTVTP